MNIFCLFILFSSFNFMCVLFFLNLCKDSVLFLSLGIWGPHLIVVRTCRLLNWEVEFKRWCPGLKILLYFGNKRERRSTRAVWSHAPLAPQNSVGASFSPSKKLLQICKHYGILHLQWWGEANSFHVCVTSYKLLMKDQGHFLRRRWRHIVLDEVQLIKNMTEKHWETILALKR